MTTTARSRKMPTYRGEAVHDVHLPIDTAIHSAKVCRQQRKRREVRVMRWEVGFEIWPHSTGRGREIDQQEAGARHMLRSFTADDIAEALEKASLFASGVAEGPMVWRVPIMSIVRETP